MSKNQRTYTREFKIEAVRLLESTGKSQTEVERELGITEGETTPDLEYTLETVACIGACALAPTMVINQNTCGKLTPTKVAEIFSRKDRKERVVD